ncbi:acyl-CoA dehydrogenase family protein [Tamaricihabitans halophyticus]|nr:acyl-CoA dehydrogenase family protein [Tamaricihabitans halophyticus]
MGLGMAVVKRMAGSSLLDKVGLRKPVERALVGSTRAGFQAAGAASRAFTKVSKLRAPARPATPNASATFDLTPTEDEQLIASTVREFASEQLRPAAAQANEDCAPPDGLLAKTAELGLHTVAVPEELGGLATERSAIAGVLIAEELARGDMGLALACLAPSAVSTALSLWGDADQQATYLPAFLGERPPAAALALQEPRALFDPRQPRTRARRTPDGYRLDGTKSLVPLAGSAELFVVSAELEGRGPGLFLIEANTRGVRTEPEPAMGLRAAATGQLHLDGVRLAGSSLLGMAAGTEVLTECVRLSRLAWCALAVGTAQSVLDYVVPYVNEREAFGEPVSHRQGVAFRVADIGTELEGMRLATYRAASRAQQGLSYARETALARTLCAEKGMTIGSDGVQLLGGHGFTKEHPVERWYRDLRAIGLMEGAVLV